MSLFQITLLASSALLALGSGVAWHRGRLVPAVALLMGAAFLVRLLMSSLDPFLHDWDERFHALVAKNMISQPLTPLLRAEAVLPYDYRAWCCNHIWLHKQPLFLWQMALSMKVFGVNELALRLPSALLGSLVLYPVYRLGCLLFDPDTGYLGALLAAFAFYQLEQTSGVIGMDHNDVAFAAYVTAGLWAYSEYRGSAHPWRWVVLVGLFAGAAVLCKWLVGLIVYAGWGLATLLHTPRRWAEYGRLAASVVAAGAVALPWQLYTAWRFPAESAHERAYNARHFAEALEGQAHEWYYHFEMLATHYGALQWLMPLGLALALRSPRRQALVPALVVLVLIYAFFTAAATKMYSYTYVVSALLLLLAAVPLAAAARWLRARTGRLAPAGLAAGLVAVVLLDARPWAIVGYHFQEQMGAVSGATLGRASRTANADLYRHLNEAVPSGYLIFNALGSDELPAMFYCDRPVYGWWPSETALRSLQAQGWRLAFFPDHHDQHPPDYLRRAPGALAIWGTPQ